MPILTHPQRGQGAGSGPEPGVKGGAGAACAVSCGHRLYLPLRRPHQHQLPDGREVRHQRQGCALRRELQHQLHHTGEDGDTPAGYQQRARQHQGAVVKRLHFCAPFFLHHTLIFCTRICCLTSGLLNKRAI